MYRFAAGIALVLLMCSGAAAQSTVNPVTAHFRAYTTALNQGDLTTAEAEADLALRASEVRDGDDGATAVLALNLATTRILRGDSQAAIAPAQRALALAEAGAANVDPLFAALVLGRAELAGDDPVGAARLQQALTAPGIERLPETEIYPAASSLGLYLIQHRDFPAAERAWTIAYEHAAGSPLGEEFGAGSARTWQAGAIIYDEIGAHGVSRMRRARAEEAYRFLSEAMQRLRPMSELQPPNFRVTLGLRAFADASALRAILRAKMMTDGQPIPQSEVAEGDSDGFAELAEPTDLLLPRCAMRLIGSPRPEYPDRQLARGHLGAAIVMVRINAAGETTNSMVVSHVGDDDFAEAIERVAPRWRAERAEDAPANCRMEADLIVPVLFFMGRR